jgi:hypothetical protein
MHKRGMSYARVIHKKRKKKKRVEKKWTSIQIIKTMGT